MFVYLEKKQQAQLKCFLYNLCESFTWVFQMFLWSTYLRTLESDVTKRINIRQCLAHTNTAHFTPQFFCQHQSLNFPQKQFFFCFFFVVFRQRDIAFQLSIGNYIQIYYIKFWPNCNKLVQQAKCNFAECSFFSKTQSQSHKERVLRCGSILLKRLSVKGQVYLILILPKIHQSFITASRHGLYNGITNAT